MNRTNENTYFSHPMEMLMNTITTSADNMCVKRGDSTFYGVCWFFLSSTPSAVPCVKLHRSFIDSSRSSKYILGVVETEHSNVLPRDNCEE